MKLKWKIVTLVVLLGILSLASLSPSQAATVWSDNFDDGNMDGWTIYEGGFTCAGYRLEGHSGVDFNDASHASTVAGGTWSFDVYHRVIIFFMASDLDPGTDWPNDSYGLAYDPSIDAWRLVRHTDGAFAPMKRSYEHTDGPVSVVITRNATDFIHIWIEDDLVMTDQDSTHSSSEYFYVQCQEGAWIDNIVVSNTVDRVPEDGNGQNGGQEYTPIPIEVVILGIIGVSVIIIIAVVLLIRRSKVVS